MRILDYQHSFSYVGGTYTAYLKPNVINASVDSLYSGTVDQGSEYLYEYTYTQEELGGWGIFHRKIFVHLILFR